MVEWCGELSAEELPSSEEGVKGEGEREEWSDGDSAPKKIPKYFKQKF